VQGFYETSLTQLILAAHEDQGCRMGYLCGLCRGVMGGSHHKVDQDPVKKPISTVFQARSRVTDYSETGFSSRRMPRAASQDSMRWGGP